MPIVDSIHITLKDKTLQNWTDILLGEILICSLLSRVFYVYPKKEWLQSLINENIFYEVPFGQGQSDVDAGLAILQRWSASNAGGLSQVAFDAVEADYMHLFVGTNKVLAPPWESYYLNKDHLLFQRETLQVRNWYRRFGLAIENLYHEPDDHLGIEFSFIAYLARQGLQACEAGDLKKLKYMLKAQNEFIRTHPRCWIRNWQHNVEENAKTDFYLGISKLALGVLDVLETILERATEKEAIKEDTADA